jgi:hypothetical protein
MKFPNLKKIIAPNAALSVLLVVLYLFTWAMNYVSFPDFNNYDGAVARITELNKSVSMIIILIITAVNLLLIDRFNYKFNIIRTKTFLPLFIYALLITTWRESHILIFSHISLSIIIVSMMFFFDMYRNKLAVEQAFLGSLFIGLLSLFNPVFIVIIGIVWLGFVLLNCFSVRAFLASLMGLVIPWIFYVAYHLISSREILIFQHLSIDLTPDLIFNQKEWHVRIYVVSILLILIAGLFSLYRTNFNDSIQTRKYLNYLVMLLLLVLIPVLFLSNNILSFLPLIAFGYSMLLSHPFSLQKSKWLTVLFFLFVAVNAAYLFYNFSMAFQ